MVSRNITYHSNGCQELISGHWNVFLLAVQKKVDRHWVLYPIPEWQPGQVECAPPVAGQECHEEQRHQDVGNMKKLTFHKIEWRAGGVSGSTIGHLALLPTYILPISCTTHFKTRSMVYWHILSTWHEVGACWPRMKKLSWRGEC